MVMIVAAVTVIVVLALPGYLWAMVRVPQNARRQLASDMSWGIVVGLVNWILTMSWGDSSQYSPIQVAISGALMVAWVCGAHGGGRRYSCVLFQRRGVRSLVTPAAGPEWQCLPM